MTSVFTSPEWGAVVACLTCDKIDFTTDNQAYDFAAEHRGHAIYKTEVTPEVARDEIALEKMMQELLEGARRECRRCRFDPHLMRLLEEGEPDAV